MRLDAAITEVGGGPGEETVAASRSFARRCPFFSAGGGTETAGPQH